MVMERWGVCPKEVSDEEEESVEERHGEFDPVRLLKSIVVVSSKPRSKCQHTMGV